MRVKKLLASLITVCLAISMAACGNTGEKAGQVTEEQNGSAVEKVEEDNEIEPARETELNIMMSMPRLMEEWEAYAKQFEEKMLKEENIRVKINLEMPSSDQYESVLQARLTGDDAPDLYTVHCNNLEVYDKAGNLADLSGEPLADKIYDNVRETVTINGKLLAVPLESQAWGVLYNKEIFEECGLEAPDTLDDLKEICEKLKESGYTPFLLAFQEQWVPQLMTALAIGGKVSGEATDWLERMYKDEGSYSEIADIFDVIDVIMENGTERAMEEGSESGGADFANGKAAMFVQGTWASGTIMETNPDMQLGVFPLPVNNNKECTRVNLSTSTTLAVYPGSDELELAIKFANYVLDDENSSELFRKCSFNPLANNHNYEAASWVAEASKYVAAGRAYQDLVLPSAVTDEQGKLLQEYYVGSVTKEEMIETLDNAFKNANKVNN